MKRLFFVFFISLSIFAAAQGTSHKPNVLFIGNSYTAQNNLPQMISDIASSAGDTLLYNSNLPGGCTFQQHVNNQSMTLIKQGEWDYVVLQEQSQYPAFPIGQVQNDCFPYAKMLVDSIRKYNFCSEPMFYMTWGRKNGDHHNCPHYPPICTYEGMDDLLYERYNMMGEDNSASVAPVGAVWRYIRTNHPEIELYDADESHPNTIGSYAAACTFYVMLFQKNTSVINDNISMDANYKQVIKNAVNVVVFDSLEKWINKTEQNVLADFLYEEIKKNTIKFENQSTNANNYNWDFGDGESSMEENPIHEYENSGDYLVTLTASDGCDSDKVSYSVHVTDSSDVSILDLDTERKISSFPNPVKDNLTIVVPNETFSNDYTVKFYDESGKLLYVKNNIVGSHNILDVSFLSSGVYFIHFIQENTIIFKDKFVKQ